MMAVSLFLDEAAGGAGQLSGIALLVLMLASFRLTHLIVFDEIMEPVRARLDSVPVISMIINCYWCCGIWVSGALVLGYMAWPSVTRVVALILAVAAGQALLEYLVQKE